MLNLDKILNMSFSVNLSEKILILKKRRMDLAKHFSRLSKHTWFIECNQVTPQYSNRFIINSLKNVGLILSVKSYEPFFRRPVMELTFLQIETVWSSKLSLLSMITPRSLKVLTNFMFLLSKMMYLC